MESAKKETSLECSILSSGIALGSVFIYRDILTRDISSYSISKKDVAYELRRIVNSFSDVKKELHKLGRSVSYNISSEDGGIFEAQCMMLEDVDFIYEFKKEIHNELINAEQVTRNVFRKYINTFDDSTNETLRAKADDLRDILRKVLRNLLGITTSILEKLPKNTIIIARRLFPSDTIRLDTNNVNGILVQEGSFHAHSALLARSLGIAALCTNGIPVKNVSNGDQVIIDAMNGKAIINPGPARRTEYKSKKESSSIEVTKSVQVTKGMTKTASGKTIKLMANAGSEHEVRKSVECGCDGIGLFRLEMLYLESRTMPDEQELYVALYKALSPAKNFPVTVRVLDIGGDKRLPYLQFEEDISPSLGLRGIRFLLKNPELLLSQLKVLLRIRKDFKIRISLPMITIPEEIETVRSMLQSCKKELGITSKKSILLGTMIETPAAALNIDEILDVSDFISIGTNDLTQYIMASSRENPAVAQYYDKGFKYILPLIKNISDACKREKKECTICGEMANDEQYLEKFVQAGVSNFSISSFRIPELKQFVKQIGA